MRYTRILKLIGLGAALVLFALAAGKNGQVGLAQAGCTITLQPGQSIQQAINNAPEDAVICLGAGTFQENIEIKKSLTLRGTGREMTILKGKEGNKAVVAIFGPEAITVILERFTIAQSLGFFGNGIAVDGQAKVIMRDSLISDHEDDGLIVKGSAQVNLFQTMISRNKGEGLKVFGSAEVALTDSQIADNGGFPFGSVHLSGASKVSLINSEVLRSRDYHGIVVRENAHLSLNNAVVANNGGDFFGGHALVVQDFATIESQDSSFLDNRGCGIFVMFRTVRVLGVSQTFQGNGADLCGFAPAAFRKPLVTQTDKNQIAVPGDYPSLQAAVDAVAPGGVISVSGGTYETGLTIWKPLTLRGSDRTTLRALPGRSMVVAITAEVDGTTLEGLGLSDSLQQALLIFGNSTLRNIEIFKNGGGVFQGALHIGGFAQVTLQNIRAFDNLAGLSVDGAARVTVTDSEFASSFFNGIRVAESARMSIANSRILKNGDGLNVVNAATVGLRNVELSGNRGTGIELHGAATVEVQDSRIEGNGTASYCEDARASDILSCDGIFVADRAQLTLSDTVIKNNGDWGIGAFLRQCQYERDAFNGMVKFQGTITIEGNNKHGNYKGLGNPGNHPFKNLPDGQVCMP